MLNELSVVIPAYRSEALIARTLESILQEGVLAENIIVVEDGVFDNTKAVSCKYNVKHIVQVKNMGAPTARNVGLAEVKTKYVMFIDSDDFVSDKLISGLVCVANSTGADIAFGPWCFDGDKMKTGTLRYPPALTSGEWVLFWLNHGVIPTCSVLWRVDSIRSIFGWDERLKKNQDGEIVIRAFLNDFSIGISTQGYSTYWQHESQHRVSDAHIIDRDFTSNIVYELIMSKAANVKQRHYSYEIGRYCCKESWMCFANNYIEGGVSWKLRAQAHGYSKKGYSLATNIFGGLFGYKLGAKIKHFLFPYFKKLIHK